MSQPIGDYFDVPFGIAQDGTILLATVMLRQPLKPGHVARIAQQMGRLAVIAEDAVAEEEQVPASRQAEPEGFFAGSVNHEELITSDPSVLLPNEKNP